VGPQFLELFESLTIAHGVVVPDSSELRRLLASARGTPAAFKVILVGASGAGKTALVLRAARGSFHSEGMKATVGVDFFTMKYEIHGKLCELQVPCANDVFFFLAGEGGVRPVRPN
jgi:GTPase SAR1 family protein